MDWVACRADNEYSSQTNLYRMMNIWRTSRGCEGQAEEDEGNPGQWIDWSQSIDSREKPESRLVRDGEGNPWEDYVHCGKSSPLSPRLLDASIEYLFFSTLPSQFDSYPLPVRKKCKKVKKINTSVRSRKEGNSRLRCQSLRTLKAFLNVFFPGWDQRSKRIETRTKNSLSSCHISSISSWLNLSKFACHRLPLIPPPPSHLSSEPSIIIIFKWEFQEIFTLLFTLSVVD